MASTATIMKELFQEFSSNLDAKLDLIWNLNDDATVNPVDEPAILKARRLALEKADGYSDVVITNASSSLQLRTADHTINPDTANDNLAMETQQVRIITDKTSVTTRWRNTSHSASQRS
jgi:hypothetical protein